MKYFLPALTLLLIGLKLTGHIDDWSWWWAWAPILVPLLVLGTLSAIFALIGWIVRLLETPEERAARNAQQALRNLSRHFDRKR
jgi:hypothetical protein